MCTLKCYSTFDAYLGLFKSCIENMLMRNHHVQELCIQSQLSNGNFHPAPLRSHCDCPCRFLFFTPLPRGSLLSRDAVAHMQTEHGVKTLLVNTVCLQMIAFCFYSCFKQSNIFQIILYITTSGHIIV